VAYWPRALVDDQSMFEALRRCDSIVHLYYRRPSGHRLGEQLAGEVFANLVPTVRILSAAQAASVRHVCFASTTTVYTPPARGASEGAPVGGAVSPYALIKLEQESWIRQWADRNGRRAAILRLATVYGPGETVSRAVPNFIRAALTGRRPILDGRGTQPFELIHVDDVSEAFVLALSAQADGVFNIGTGAGHTPRELAERILRMCGRDLTPVESHLVPERGGTVCDVSRAASILGFVATTPLAAGLEGEIEWFRESIHRTRIVA
jgi:UDP-glucose 4-epimerase